jgi:hypothetical protein
MLTCSPKRSPAGVHSCQVILIRFSDSPLADGNGGELPALDVVVVVVGDINVRRTSRHSSGCNNNGLILIGR